MTGFIRIEGGSDVVGDIHVSGSKNAGLALMAASLLTPGQHTLSDIPALGDVAGMTQIFRFLGAEIKHSTESMEINTTQLKNSCVGNGLTSSLRASIMILGPLIARFGFASIGLPGGCQIGSRPIEEHVYGLEKLGANIHIIDDMVEASAPTGLRGATITMTHASVTATMMLLMSACLASGTTTIVNAAREPEVMDLSRCLISMGALISGVDSDCLVIRDSRSMLQPFRYRVMKDRIEAGTFLILGALAGCPLRIHGCDVELQTSLINALRVSGASVEPGKDVVVVRKAAAPTALSIRTGPYPSFPTDLQPQLMAYLCKARGISLIDETVFESRFKQCEGLSALGADITVDSNVAHVHGVEKMGGAVVTAPDLRAGASLILGAITARGTTVIKNAALIDRGYSDVEKKLGMVGVKITRVATVDI